MGTQERTRKLAETSTQDDIITGGILSPASLMHAYGQGKFPEEAFTCPLCRSIGAYWEHVFWTCEERPDEAPRKPAHPMQARFGWATSTNKEENREIIRWMERIVEKMWADRYGQSMSEKRERIAKAKVDSTKRVYSDE